ncbi:pilus assembly protein N-terminal domain-containing protein [Ruegeria atlantica]|uniref:pilus assembly protein N-terminal domain-containing protein n=1 Tax=Ruegeria atlantica TaxID=81569 RepID=UPI00147EC674|nr:pilus assembly protein N-terminal domain-containing protein [Ruegeria atlantica]
MPVKLFIFCLIALISAWSPISSNAETLQVLRGNPSAAIVIAPDSTITLESAERFVETSIANARIADIANLSSQKIALSGLRPGRTTLSVFYGDFSMNNVDIVVLQNAVASDTQSSLPLPNTPILEEVSLRNGRTIDSVPLPASGAIIVGSDVPFQDWSVKDSSILDAVILFENWIYVLGREPGTTTLTLWRHSDAETHVTIEVQPNMYDVE